MLSEFSINGRSVGAEHSPFIIAEVAQAHEGSLGMAHAFVDAVADAGADAIKFQTHIAAAESTPEEPFRVPFRGGQDASRYAYWRRMEFTAEQWAGLADHAAERGIVFLSTPFSLEAITLLERLGMPAWKIGSGEVTNQALLDAVSATAKPVLLSSGMSPWVEIGAAVQRVREGGAPVAVMQCTSRYPTAFADVGLNIIDEIRSRYGVPAGLSDHSGTPFPALAAMARGADIIEVHVTFHRKMFGPDVIASLTFEELKFVMKARDAFTKMDLAPVAKEILPHDLQRMRSLFNKSLALRTAQSAGTKLTPDMLTFKKPGTGIPADSFERVVGRTLKQDTSADRVLTWHDVEDPNE